MHVYIFYVISLLALVSPSNSQQWYETGNPHFLDVNNVFEAIKETNTIKIIKFFSPWCMYCRYIKAYLQEYKNTHEVNSNLKFYDFNCNSNGPMFCWQNFQVRAYPSVIIFDQNGVKSSRFDGVYPKQVNKKAGQVKAKVQQKPQQLQIHEEQQEQKQQQNQQQQLPQENKNAKSKQTKSQQVKQQNEVKEEQKKQQQKEDSKNLKQKQKQAVTQQKIVTPQKPAELKQISKQVQKTKQQPQKKIQTPNNEVKEEEKKVEQKKQQAKTNQIKIVKSMVEQTSLQSSTKPNPSKPELENQIFETNADKSEGYPFIKYLFYIVGISLAVLYGIKIFTNKQTQSTSTKNNMKQRTQNQGSNQKTKTITKITTQDIQNQILVEEVADENL